MIVKIHNFPSGTVLTITDSDLIGQRFEEGKRQLDLTSSFYSGEEKSESEIKKLLKDEKIGFIHFTGEKSLALGIKEGLVDPKKVVRIKNIPHAQVFIS